MPRRVWGREVGTHNSALEYARPLSGCVYMQSPITASELSGEPVAPSRPSTCGMYPDSKSVCKGNLADGNYFLEKGALANRRVSGATFEPRLAEKFCSETSDADRVKSRPCGGRGGLPEAFGIWGGSAQMMSTSGYITRNLEIFRRRSWMG
jgi:hypothetical protein